MRVSTPPDLDGHDDDLAWRGAQPVDDFRVFAPEESGSPTFRTEMRVVYDDHALYVLVRSYDPEPDKIIGRLARRDTDGLPNDQVQLFIDSYHDRRNAYEYIVNPAGVKSDYLLFDDSDWDQSWDGIWDVATGVDSAGWVAEYQIPFQQLRFAGNEAPTFGFMLWRLVGRLGERVSWPEYRSSRAGLVSQAGTLTGIIGLDPQWGLEASPYVLGRVRTSPANDVRWTWEPAVGGDLRFQPRPNVSIAATFNPDFGQVEADPAVLNLTAFELRQEERRPFFLEGAGLLRFPLAADGSSLLFYSRRIGRRPTLAGAHSAAQTETTILAAARTTARLAPGFSIAGLSALTAEELGPKQPEGTYPVIEPRAHYGVLRAQYEFREGRSGVDAMLTRVDRGGGDSATAALLAGIAQAAAVSVRHETQDGNYQVSGWRAFSSVKGTSAAIAELQLSPVHAYQRPDDSLEFDPLKTQLGGTATHIALKKRGGNTTRFAISYRSISPGFDVNDAGYLGQADVKTVSVRAGLEATSEGDLWGLPYRAGSITIGFDGDWTAGGLPQARWISLAGSLQLPNQSTIDSRIAADLPGAYCTIDCSRGGPAIVDPPRQELSIGYSGDSRRVLVPQISLQYTRDDGGRSAVIGGVGSTTWRVRSNVEALIALELFDADHDWFFYRRFGAAGSDTAIYTVAALEGSIRGLTGRLNYTVTRDLSLQWYAQAYLSRGTYSDVRELAEPRSANYASRFRTFRNDSVVANPGGIDFREVRSNAVLRWEYRPGSTLFLVWSQAWQRSSATAGDVQIGRDLRELFNDQPDATLALKVSYRLDR